MVETVPLSPTHCSDLRVWSCAAWAAASGPSPGATPAQCPMCGRLDWDFDGLAPVLDARGTNTAGSGYSVSLGCRSGRSEVTAKKSIHREQEWSRGRHAGSLGRWSLSGRERFFDTFKEAVCRRTSTLERQGERFEFGGLRSARDCRHAWDGVRSLTTSPDQVERETLEALQNAKTTLASGLLTSATRLQFVVDVRRPGLGLRRLARPPIARRTPTLIRDVRRAGEALRLLKRRLGRIAAAVRRRVERPDDVVRRSPGGDGRVPEGRANDRRPRELRVGTARYQ